MKFHLNAKSDQLLHVVLSIHEYEISEWTELHEVLFDALLIEVVLATVCIYGGDALGLSSRSQPASTTVPFICSDLHPEE